MADLTNSADIDVVDGADEVLDVPLHVLPSLPLGEGTGKVVHPLLGVFDYEFKPDEWTNIDDDAIIPPIWASTSTLGGAVNVKWQGYIRDVVHEQRWKSLGGLAMPVSQLRLLNLLFQNPLDPQVGYLTLYPSYANEFAYKAILISVGMGGGEVVLDDIVNAKTPDGGPNGWVTAPVTVVWKLVEKIDG